MRLFVTGDVHAGVDHDKIASFKDLMEKELTLNDYLVVCGDFGVLWDNGEDDAYFKEWYANFPCTILWVDGNHENFDLLYSYPVESWCGGKVHKISDRILHLMRGEVFQIFLKNKTVKIFSLGGAKSSDRGYNTGFNENWWELELPTKNEKLNAIINLEKHENKVDYIFTHDAPVSVLSRNFDIKRDFDKGFNELLEKINSTVSFKAWYFGHNHQDKSSGNYKMVFNTVLEVL